MLFGRLPSVPMDNISFQYQAGSSDKLVKMRSVSARKEVASLAGRLFCHLLPMDNILFREVETSW
jgi:hypothetical protein